MKTGLIILAVLVVIALVVGGMFIGPRNQMAIKREAINLAFAQVDVVLQRRADLIPNLVATVKGFAQHEEAVFSEVANARAGYMNAATPADKIAANTRLEASLSKVLFLQENYPQLKSNENFLRLQDELAGTENRIAVERKRYNDTVQDYNTFIATFPNSFIASIAGFTRNDAYFKTEPGARTAPKVDFTPAPAPTSSTPAPAPAQR